MDISQNNKLLKRTNCLVFGSTETLIQKIKKGENVPSLELVEVVLVQCKLADHQY